MAKPHRVGKRIAAILVVVCGTIFVLRTLTGPPHDEEISNTFERNRQTFETLRDMMLADNGIAAVMKSGVERPNEIGTLTPPTPEITTARYEKYKGLLDLVDGINVSQMVGRDQLVCVLLWRAGLGDSIHVSICWIPRETISEMNRIESKMHAEGRAAPRHKFSYHSISDDWYISKDF